MKSKFKLLAPCYYAFFVNGMMVLLVGSILPYLIEEAGVNYSVAGGFLSAFAIGNLAASFINPLLVNKIGRKAATVIMSALIPISFLVITFVPPVPVIYAAFVCTGIGRGAVSIINNAVVNDNSDGRPAALNILHMVFAIGAFLAPFLTALYVQMGFNWRAVVYTIIVLSAFSVVGYALMNLNYEKEKADDSRIDESQPQKAFYKNATFYICGFLLFLYLGLENCVNGWFVTYFKSMNIMSAAYASNLVSITWIMVMLGRLMTAKLSAKINKDKLILTYCIATAVFFILLISTHNLALITVAIAGLGFFFAGIYPTSVSSVGDVLRGSNTGMSMFLALSALGGIVTPQIVGIAADKVGLTAAIMVLAFNAAGMLILSAVNVVRRNR